MTYIPKNERDGKKYGKMRMVDWNIKNQMEKNQK